MNWLSLHWTSLRDAMRRLGLAPVATFFTALAMGVAITLPAGLYLTLKNIDHLAGDFPAHPEVSVFVSRKASDAQRAHIAQQLRQRGGLSQLHFVSGDEALSQLNQRGLADLTAGLDHNPLPDAWIFNPSQTTPEHLDILRRELSALPGVDSVLADSAWAERLHAILRIGERAVWLLAALFGLALIAITGNAIRTQILARREEIEVSRLIGATDRFIRRPFLYYGILQGLTGALAALSLLALLGYLLSEPAQRLASLYGLGQGLRMPSLPEILAVPILSTLASWIGAWFSVNQCLRQID